MIPHVVIGIKSTGEEQARIYVRSYFLKLLYSGISSGSSPSFMRSREYRDAESGHALMGMAIEPDLNDAMLRMGVTHSHWDHNHVYHRFGRRRVLNLSFLRARGIEEGVSLIVRHDPGMDVSKLITTMARKIKGVLSVLANGDDKFIVDTFVGDSDVLCFTPEYLDSKLTIQNLTNHA